MTIATVAFVALTATVHAQYTFSTLVGAGPRPGMMATASSAARVIGVAWDSQGRFYYSQTNQVVRVNQLGIIDLVIGNGLSGFGGDGGLATADSVALRFPGGLAVDSFNNLFIADTGNSRLRKVDGVSGNISTIAGTGVAGSSGDGGQATSSQVVPGTLAVDSNGNLYLSDYYSARVRKIASGTGVITSVAGTGANGFSGDGGPAVNATIGLIQGLAVDALGNLYLADTTNSRIRKVTAQTGTISTIAGKGLSDDSGDNGLATAAGISSPVGVAVDSTGNVYLGTSQFRIRKISAVNGLITTYAGPGNGAFGFSGYTGDGGLAVNATFTGGGQLAIDPSGNLLFADNGDSLVLQINGATTRIKAVAGNLMLIATQGDGGPASVALLSSISGLALGPVGTLYFSDSIASRVRQIVSQDSVTHDINQASTVSAFAGGGTGYGGDGGLAIGAGLGNYSARTANPIPIATDSAGNSYLISTGNVQGATPITRIRKISGGIITAIAGGGTLQGSAADGGLAINADLTGAKGLTANAAAVYVTDGSGNIRKIDVASGVISTIAQNTYATAIDVDAAGNLYFVAGSSIGKYSADTGQVKTIAGSYLPCSGVCNLVLLGLYTGAQLGDGGLAVNATLNSPQSVRVDLSGNVYIADTGAHRVRKISEGTSIITTIAGINAVGCSKSQGPATSSLLAAPSALAVDANGTVYVGDNQCVQVSKLTTAVPPVSYAGYLDNANCTSISGWAADKNRLGQSITVSIYDNSTLLTNVAANQSRGDVGAVLGDNGLHGFSYTIPGGLSPGVSHNIRVVYDTSTVDIVASPRAVSCTAGYAGYIDSSSCSGISGWVADKTRLNQPIVVTLWDGAVQIASITANGSRSDVGSFLGDNGLHGFSIPIPAGYSNGVGHTLQVRYESSSTQVPGSPVSLTCGVVTTPVYAGYIDTSNCNAISGWAADRSRLNLPILVTLWDGGTQIASVTANSFRSDVGNFLGDNGMHAFSLSIPPSVANGVGHTLQIRYETSTQQLPNSPVTLTCGSGGVNYAGYVDSASCNGINGWAADKLRLNQPLTVSLWDGVLQLASTTANASRSDVGNFLGDNGLHGFSVPIPPGYLNGVPHTLQMRFETSNTQVSGVPVTFTCGSSTP